MVAWSGTYLPLAAVIITGSALLGYIVKWAVRKWKERDGTS